MAHLAAVSAADEQACLLLPPGLAVARRMAADSRQLLPVHRPQQPPLSPAGVAGKAVCHLHDKCGTGPAGRSGTRRSPQHAVQLSAQCLPSTQHGHSTGRTRWSERRQACPCAQPRTARPPGRTATSAHLHNSRGRGFLASHIMLSTPCAVPHTPHAMLSLRDCLSACPWT
jgi:hypothetical protein